jgi:type IV pilus assembly protein PilO
MELVTRFRTPIITAVGVLVAVIVVYAAWISPEGSKLSSLHGKETQLQSQQVQLQAEIGTLKHDKAQMVSNCQQLTKDLTEIPVTPSVDSFLQQVTQLAIASGDPNTPSISVTNAPASAGHSGVSTVAVSLALSGDFSQMRSFVSGLDSFPRLFSVSTITMEGGPVSGQGISASSPGPYSLNLDGDIYYTTGQQNVCAETTNA